MHKMKDNYTLTVYNKKTSKYENLKFVCTKGEMRRKIDRLERKYIPMFVAKNGEITF